MATGALHIPGNPRHRDPTKGLGLEIDVWKFVPVERNHEGETRLIKIFFVKPEDGTVQGMEFVARHPELPDGEIGSSDIEALRVLVNGTMTRLFAAMPGIVWEDWLEVQTSGREDVSSYRHVAGQTLHLEYKTIVRGHHPDEPSVDVTRGMNGFIEPFPLAKAIGETELGPMVDYGRSFGMIRESGRSKDTGFGYVRDTPANRLALDQMISSLATLRDRIAHFLGGEQIAQSMLDIHRGQLAIALQSQTSGTPQTSNPDSSPVSRRATAAEEALSGVILRRRGQRP